MKSRKYSTPRLNYSRGPALRVHTHTQMWALMWWEGLRHALLSEECVGGQWAKTNGVLARRSAAVKQQRLRVQTADLTAVTSLEIDFLSFTFDVIQTDRSTYVPFIWLSTSSAEAPLGFKGRTPTAFKVKTAAGLLFYKCHIVPPSFLVHNWATPGFLVLINSFGERSKLGLFMWGSQVWRRVSWRVFSLEWTLSSRVAALFSLQRIEARIHSVLRFTATSVSTCQHQKTHLGNQSSQFPLDHWSYWDESLKCAVKWYSLFTLIEDRYFSSGTQRRIVKRSNSLVLI